MPRLYMETRSEPGRGIVPAVTRVEVSRLSGPDALSEVTSEWDQLDARLSPRTPFTGALWNQLWWKHFRSTGLLVRDDLYVYTGRDGAGRLVAVAPMMLTRRPSRGPVQGRLMQCFGADRNITEIRGIICQPEHGAAMLRSLSAHFVESAAPWDWIDWGSFREDGITQQELARSGVTGWDRACPSYYLRLPATWDEFRGRLGRNIKESLRKCYNSLKRDGHSFQLQVVEAPEKVPLALGTFFRLHRARAQSNVRLKHTDVFATPRDQAFLIDYAVAMALRGQVRIFQLTIGGEVVATRVGFLLGHDLYLYYSGYEMRWAPYSVMTTLLAEAIKWAIEQKVRIVNLSTGEDVSKTRWSPESVSFRSAIQLRPRWRSRAAFGAYDRFAQIGAQDSWLGKLSRLIRR
jgi:CelD/BcsL family acetyltransferase involved in cellulose biosynthesis